MHCAFSASCVPPNSHRPSQATSPSNAASSGWFLLQGDREQARACPVVLSALWSGSSCMVSKHHDLRQSHPWALGRHLPCAFAHFGCVSRR